MENTGGRKPLTRRGDDRQQRTADALRANLRKRKDQQRQRAARATAPAGDRRVGDDEASGREAEPDR